MEGRRDPIDRVQGAGWRDHLLHPRLHPRPLDAINRVPTSFLRDAQKRRARSEK